MTSAKKNKKGKKLFIFILILLMVSPLLQVVTKARLSEINIDVEKLKDDIEDQQKLNESINMQINELASLDKIRKIAEENGLSYKNNNITSIDSERRKANEE
ncbi:MAG: cell division protein FtsL [bacterium]|nr:cell division protein FtsL [bacterium]